MNDSQTPSANDGPRQPGQMYWYVVCLLLIVMIGCLAFLWFTERNQHRACVAVIADYQQKQSGLAELLKQGLSSYVAPLRAEEKTSREAVLDGQRRAVVVIESNAGKRLGFAPGDVIFVQRAEGASRPQ